MRVRVAQIVNTALYALRSREFDRLLVLKLFHPVGVNFRTDAN